MLAGVDDALRLRAGTSLAAAEATVHDQVRLALEPPLLRARTRKTWRPGLATTSAVRAEHGCGAPSSTQDTVPPLAL
jgi:hypothetical protein